MGHIPSIALQLVINNPSSSVSQVVFRVQRLGFGPQGLGFRVVPFALFGLGPLTKVPTTKQTQERVPFSGNFPGFPPLYTTL